MNNTTISNIFINGLSNIAYVNTILRQLMRTIAYRLLKFESMIKNSIMQNRKYFAVVTFSKINSFAFVISIVISIYNIKS